MAQAPMIPTHNGLTLDGSTPQRTKARPAIWRFQQKSREAVSPKAQA